MKLIFSKIKNFFGGLRSAIYKNRRSLLWSLLALSLLLFTVGNLAVLQNVMLIGALALLVHNILYSMLSFRKNFLFFVFHVTIFVFLWSRPLIDLLIGNDWIVEQSSVIHMTEASVYLASTVIYISMLFIFLGGLAAEYWHAHSRKKEKQASGRLSTFLCHPDATTTSALRVLSGSMLVVSFAFKMLLELEKAKFVFENNYVAFYSGFVSSLPYLFYVLSTFFPFALFLFLATKPKKGLSTTVLVMFVLSALPMFLGGERGPFVINVLVSLIYYVYRDYDGDTRIWVGKFEKVAMWIGIPLMIVLLGLINFIRNDVDPNMGPFRIAVDFFYSQGVTFLWVCGGMFVLPTLRATRLVSYTFGGLIDYVTHGTLAQLLFNAADLGGKNSMIMATQSNSMDHRLSLYMQGKEAYLAGHGCGSSYLVELMADFGIIGVILFSLLLGALLVSAFRICKKGVLPTTFLLCSLSGIIYMPRSNALGGLEFLWRYPFWLAIISCYFGAYLWKKLKGRCSGKSCRQ